MYNSDYKDSRKPENLTKPPSNYFPVQTGAPRFMGLAPKEKQIQGKQEAVRGSRRPEFLKNLNRGLQTPD